MRNSHSAKTCENFSESLLRFLENMEITPYSEYQLSALSRELVKHGFFFHRLCFAWGVTPGIRNRSGTCFYFLHNDEILTPRQMLERLVGSWHPATAAEMLFYQNRLRAHFESYPKGIPEWEGLDIAEVLSRADAAMEMSPLR